jgi:hypothetical protein
VFLSPRTATHTKAVRSNFFLLVVLLSLCLFVEEAARLLMIDEFGFGGQNRKSAFEDFPSGQSVAVNRRVEHRSNNKQEPLAVRKKKRSVPQHLSPSTQEPCLFLAKLLPVIYSIP